MTAHWTESVVMSTTNTDVIGEHTSESLRLPSMLFRRLAGAGLDQEDGAVRGVLR